MQDNRTRNSAPAESANGGGAVEAGSSAIAEPQRPTATGRINHPSTPLATWLNALIATSEETRASMQAALGQGVGR